MRTGVRLLPLWGKVGDCRVARRIGQRMAWKGTIFGALVGFLLTRSVVGALIGALIGVLFDQSGLGHAFPGSPPAASVSEVFFRTTFELMGHVAKSDGRVSE